jgi:hypothetical protein
MLEMAKRGVDQSVLKSFAESYPVAYHPSADEIIALHDAGISSDVITALLRRTGELSNRQWEAAQRANAERAEARKVAEVPQNTVQTVTPQRAAPAYQVNYVYPSSSWYPAYPAYYYNYSYALPRYYSSAYCYRPYRYYHSSWPRSYCWPTWPSWSSWPSYSVGVGFRSNYGVRLGYQSGYYCGRGGLGLRGYPRMAGRYAYR